METPNKTTAVLKTVSKARQSDDPTENIKRMSEVVAFSAAELDKHKIIHPRMHNKDILNIFRELRTQLLQTAKGQNFVCMVSSICPEGGGSYVATNLATAFALDKTKTSLLIDANLYAPSLTELIVGEADRGVTDYLSTRELEVKDIVYATGIPRLRVIPIGDNVEGAAEYYSSAKMKGFIDAVKSRYPDRYTFIDAPPALDSSEARILSEVSDFIILVVPYGKVTQEQVEEAIEAVGKNKLVGLVYNN